MVVSITHGSSDIERVRERRNDITRELKDAKVRIAALTSEDHELEIAERVILRLTGTPATPPQSSSILPSLRQHAQGVVGGGPREDESAVKPPGTPTMPEMIIEALQVARLRGKPGLEPKEMAEFIAVQWWSDVSINNVGPIAWRMMKRGQLTKRSKDDSLYSLADEETLGSTEPSAPSHPDDRDGTPSSNESKDVADFLAELPDASPADPGP